MGFHLSRGTLLGVVAGIAGIIASSTPFGLHLEETLGLQIMFSLRGSRAPPPDVVVVSIDKESADRLAQGPDVKNWHRALHARLTEILAERGAAVITFDLFFETGREGDSAFAEAIRKASNVVLGERLQSENVSLADVRGRPAGGVKIARKIPPIPLLADASVATSAFPLPKVPVKLSRDWTFWDVVGDNPTPTLPVVAFQLYAISATDDFLRILKEVSPARAQRLPRSGKEMVRSTGAVGMIRKIRKVFEQDPAAGKRMLEALNDSPRPADPKKRRILRSLIHLYGGGGSKFLNYYGPPRTIPTIPIYKALALGGPTWPGYPSEGDVAGKAVFVGHSEFRHDQQTKGGFYTVYTREDGVDLSGVEIAATAFANLVEDMPVRPLPFHFHVLIHLAWGLGVGILSCAFRPAIAIPGTAALSLLYLNEAGFRFATAGVWYPIIFPLAFQGPIVLLGAVGWNYVDLYRQRGHFRRAFEQYFPTDVVDELAKDVPGLKSNGRLVNSICLSTDAEKFTSLAESLDPENLAGFMNRYYEAVFESIKRHGGIVSNVVGDSILALWLTDRDDTDRSCNACRAALEIAGAMGEFRRSREEMALPTRIGLHSGEILLGNVGAAQHIEYRPVGDIVNTATRIEGLNKYLGTRILGSREVCSKLSGILTRDMGTFLLSGKTKPVHVHELVGCLEESSPRQQDYCARFSEGIDAFRRQCWDEASAKFHATLGIREEDGPSLFYLDLCARFSQSPPGDPWDGVVHMRSK